MNILHGSNPGGRIGEALGSGIAALTEAKLNQLNERQNRSGVAKALEGLKFSPEAASAIAQLPPNLQEKLILSHLDQQRNNFAPMGYQNTPFQQSQQAQQQLPQKAPYRPEPIALPESGRETVQAAANDMGIPKPMTSQQALNNALYGGKSIANPQPDIEPTAVQQNAAAPQQQNQEAEQQQPLESTQPFFPKDRGEAEDARENYKTYRDGLKAAKEVSKDIKRMDVLQKSNKINNPLWSAAVKAVTHGIMGHGLDVTSLLSPESQEFNKIATGFLKNAKTYFGARMTQGELEIFLETIPTLTNSHEGRQVLINNLKIFNEAQMLRGQLANAITNHFEGKIPANLDQLVESAGKDQLDALANEFINGTRNGAEIAAKTKVHDELPDAKKFEGKTFVNDDGKRMKSVNGEWVAA